MKNQLSRLLSAIMIGMLFPPICLYLYWASVYGPVYSVDWNMTMDWLQYLCIGSVPLSTGLVSIVAKEKNKDQNISVGQRIKKKLDDVEDHLENCLKHTIVEEKRINGHDLDDNSLGAFKYHFHLPMFQFASEESIFKDELVKFETSVQKLSKKINSNPNGSTNFLKKQEIKNIGEYLSQLKIEIGAVLDQKNKLNDRIEKYLRQNCEI